MRVARIREGQHSADPRCQLSSIDEAGDLCQGLGCDVHEEERSVDTTVQRKMLIRSGHRRNQPTASPEYLKRTRLRVAADQIDHCVSVVDFVLEALGLVVNHSLGAKLAHKGDVVRACSRDDSQTRTPLRRR